MRYYLIAAIAGLPHTAAAASANGEETAGLLEILVRYYLVYAPIALRTVIPRTAVITI